MLSRIITIIQQKGRKRHSFLTTSHQYKSSALTLVRVCLTLSTLTLKWIFINPVNLTITSTPILIPNPSLIIYPKHERTPSLALNQTLTLTLIHVNPNPNPDPNHNPNPNDNCKPHHLTLRWIGYSPTPSPTPCHHGG